MRYHNWDKLREVKVHAILGVEDSGRRLSLRCPFHSDRTPSFSLYPDGSYYCFGCSAHGKNSIDFCLQLGYSFTEIVEYLSEYT